MLKRFHDAHIWKQRWFIKLKPEDKLAFIHFKDNCDHSGIWEVDCCRLMDETGIEGFNLQKTVDSINVEYDKLTGAKIYKERLRILPNNLVWITGHIQFQFESKITGLVNPQGGPAKTALQNLYKLGLLEEAVKIQFVKILGEIPVFGPPLSVGGSQEIAPPSHENEGGTPEIAPPSHENKGGTPENAPPSHENEGRVPLNIGEGPLKKGGGSSIPPGRDKEEEEDKEKDKPLNGKDRGEGGRKPLGTGSPPGPPGFEKKYLIPEMLEIFKRGVPGYPGSVERDSPPLLNIATFICEQEKVNGPPDDNEVIVKKDWTMMVKAIALDKFLCRKSLLTLSKMVQEIYQLRQSNGYGQSNGTKVRSFGKGLVFQKP